MPGRNHGLLVGARPKDPARAASCYNCRRRRLRCDRSVPSCRKCSASGIECLGYGTVLRWANAPAVRGKLVGQLQVTRSVKSLSPPPSQSDSDSAGWDEVVYSIPQSLLDPLVKHLNRRARHYVYHFSTAVCQDLVAFDQPDHNPFRTIIPLASKFEFLEAVIIATGAMHISSLQDYEALSANAPTSDFRRPELVDALVAKDKAIRLLRAAVEDMTPENRPMVLAATVFLINLDLIDSGKGGWQVHMEAASALMSSLHDPACELDQSLMTCVNAIAADCLTYRVLGSAINGAALAAWGEQDDAEFMSVLRRSEAYSYHCCPPEILRILLSASSLCDKSTPGHNQVEEALALIYQARSLDVVKWVHSIRGLSAKDDRDIRISVALAHRATVCLYILLAVPEAAPSPSAVDILVQEVLAHLAAVPIDHVHLKGTIWPTFVVGAQTDDPVQRVWCVQRMQAVWTRNPWICPWGYIRTAVGMMQQLWAARDREPATPGRGNWLLELKSMREKCLIV